MPEMRIRHGLGNDLGGVIPPFLRSWHRPQAAPQRLCHNVGTSTAPRRGSVPFGHTRLQRQSAQPAAAARLQVSSAARQRVEQGRADVAGHRHATDRRARTSWPVSAVVVVLPLVPVMASTLPARSHSLLQVRQRLGEQIRARPAPAGRASARHARSDARDVVAGDSPGLLSTPLHAGVEQDASLSAPQRQFAPVGSCSAAACGA
jgi:hypothetical protein